MSIKNNTTSLQEVLEILNTKASGGEQATPEISINSSNGLITATAGVKSSTYQMAFQPAKTITPGTASQIAVSSGYYTGGDITVAGDSNLIAGNIKSGVSIFGVNGTAQVGGGAVVDDVSRAIIDGTIMSIECNNVETIRQYAFTTCSSLTIANFPDCTKIQHNAFLGCRNLTSVNFPTCKSIGDNAFNGCYSLTSVSFPVCTSMGTNTFCYCSNLISVNFPACKSIGANAFTACYGLTSINFPVCTSIGVSAFAECSSLTSVNLPVCEKILYSVFDCCYNLTSVSFPVCTSIYSAAFNCCSSLTSVTFPVCKSIGDNAFNGCINLVSASFPVCRRIGTNAFRDCNRLSFILLGGSSTCFLSHSIAFSSTPFAGYSAYFSGTPHIYVPASLITAYQNSTNWTYFSSYFSSIESLDDNTNNEGSEDWNGGDNTESGGDNLITFEINGIQYQAEVGMTISDWVNSGYNIDGWTIQNNNLRDSDGTRYPLLGGVNAVIEQGAAF